MTCGPHGAERHFAGSLVCSRFTPYVVASLYHRLMYKVSRESFVAAGFSGMHKLLAT